MDIAFEILKQDWRPRRISDWNELFVVWKDGDFVHYERKNYGWGFRVLYSLNSEDIRNASWAQVCAYELCNSLNNGWGVDDLVMGLRDVVGEEEIRSLADIYNRMKKVKTKTVYRG